VDLSLAADPPVTDLKLDGVPYNESVEYDTLIGFEHTVSAPATRCDDGTSYDFDGWSDGGARFVFTGVEVLD